MEGGINLFVYVAGNPINLIDLDGLQARWPDYISLTINIGFPWTGNIVGFSPGLSLDRYGNLYAGPGLNVGKSLRRFSGSLVAAWLRDECDKPTESRLNKFLSGSGINFMYGYWFGAGLQYSPTTDSAANEYGIVLPQFGVSYQYFWKIGNIGRRW